jgi:hypothetical protein
MPQCTPTEHNNKKKGQKKKNHENLNEIGQKLPGYTSRSNELMSYLSVQATSKNLYWLKI